MTEIVIRDEDKAAAGDRQVTQPAGRYIQKMKPKQRTRRRWGGRLFVLGALLLLGGGLALGAWRHQSQQQEVTATAERERDFVPNLGVAMVKASPPVRSVTLPATTAAFAQASIYARATGYVAKRDVDIGDRVKRGQLLAQLSVPEVDYQISQNEATLIQLKAAVQQAEANLLRDQITWGRDKPLVKQGWATQQQGTLDVQAVKADEAAVGVAKANAAAQEHLLQVLRQQRDYASVVAPFDGVITQRSVDTGSLVQGNINSGTFMFEIMQKDVIRVYVYVPQDAAFGVAPGVGAAVRIPELPDREFPGKVTRTATALQSGTRTLLTEIDLPNPDGVLAPGVYCTAELKIPRQTPSLIVPAEAIIFNRNGLQVAVVRDGKAEIRKVGETRDLGTQVEVDSGLQAGDQVILNPPVTLVDGSKVRSRPATIVSAE